VLLERAASFLLAFAAAGNHNLLVADNLISVVIFFLDFSV
jgi:hypothetical protein